MNTVVTKQGWFSRIKDSVIGFFFGFVLIFGSMALLAWNEHRTVKNTRGLNEGKAATISVPADVVNAANAGKLVHVSGKTATEEGVYDEEFQIEVPALALRRTVEMYQWKERKETKKEKNLGGSETTTTTYSYEKVWDEDVIDSSNFHEPGGHRNPGQFPFRSAVITARDATLGAFSLSDAQIRRIGATGSVPEFELPDDKIDAGWASGRNGQVYTGDPSRPAIGDLKVNYTMVPPSEITVIAEQSGSGFKSFVTSNGIEINLLADGVTSIEAMFEAEQASNSMLGWILRAVGFVAMWIGFGLLLNPLRVLADVIPFLGKIVGAASGFVTFLIAAVLSLLIIVISWLVVRPLLVVSVVAGAVGLFLLIGQIRGRKHPPSTLAPPLHPGAYRPDVGAPPPPPPPPPGRF